MKTITGYLVYKNFFSFRRHFSGLYDLKLYGMNPVKLPFEKYENSHEKWMFDTIAKRIKKLDKLQELLVVSFKEKDRSVYEIVDNLDSLEKDVGIWRTQVQASEYNFSQEMKELFSRGIKIQKGIADILLEEYLNGKINLNTFCICYQVFGFDRLLGEDNFIWDNGRGERIKAYMKLISFDVSKYQLISKNLLECSK